MTSPIDIEAKNVDQAIRNACDDLQISEDQLKYEILSHGSSGIFGLVQVKKAKIRVYPPQPQEPDEGRHERLPPPAGDSGSALAEDVSADGEPPFQFPGTPHELGRQTLQRIIDFLTEDAHVTVDEKDDRILFNVAGGNPGVLIGKRGQTLEAIQSLVEKIVNKHNGNHVRIQVDVAGYLETRKDNLRKLAFKLAGKSKRSGKPISLEEMNSYERRIIHLALKDDPAVRTQSRGEGYLRKLVIFPNKRGGESGARQ